MTPDFLTTISRVLYDAASRYPKTPRVQAKETNESATRSGQANPSLTTSAALSRESRLRTVMVDDLQTSFGFSSLAIGSTIRQSTVLRERRAVTNVSLVDEGTMFNLIIRVGSVVRAQTNNPIDWSD